MLASFSSSSARSSASEMVYVDAEGPCRLYGIVGEQRRPCVSSGPEGMGCEMLDLLILGELEEVEEEGEFERRRVRGRKRLMRRLRRAIVEGLFGDCWVCGY